VGIFVISENYLYLIYCKYKVQQKKISCDAFINKVAASKPTSYF